VGFQLLENCFAESHRPQHWSVPIGWLFFENPERVWEPSKKNPESKYSPLEIDF
jgi:hypothetical protein